MAAVLRMTQLLSLSPSACAFIHFPFYPYFTFSFWNFVSVFDLFFCLLFFSLPISLFPCFSVVLSLFLALENGRTITCTHNANVLVPILFLLPFVVVIAWMFASACDLMLLFVFCSHSEWFFSLLCSSVPSALSVIAAFALIELRKCLLLMLRILCMICLCISLMCWEHWAS